MYWYGSGMGGWGYGLMIVSMVLFWGLIVAGVVALVRYLGRPGQRTGSGPGPGYGGRGPGDSWPGRGDHRSAAGTPEDLLAERFARGEIDEDEYRRRLAILNERERLVGKP